MLVNECHVEMIKWEKSIYWGVKNGDEMLGFFMLRRKSYHHYPLRSSIGV
jgi:hypothetical protein